MDRTLIDHYAAGGEKLSLAVRGLTPDDLLAVPVPGKWSTQQAVIHLADAEAAFADRIRRIVAEDDAVLQEWREDRWVERLFYEKQSAADAVQLVDLTRRQTARVLRELPDDAFARTGRHTARGTQSLAAVLETATRHLDHHLHFIHEKRAAMGKEMW